jgi:uncharacterized damage-inducible protein DinB
MITDEFVKTMACYNQWQNESLYEAADRLGDDLRKLDRGAYFGSIHKTLCHLLWADMIWTSRFAGFEEPSELSIRKSADMIDDWTDMKSRRIHLDGAILSWAYDLGANNLEANGPQENGPKNGLKNGLLEGDFTWFSGAVDRQVSRPIGEILVHFFNHQTHHRGQVHAMITAAGGSPDDTDLFIMSMRKPDQGK